MLISLLICTQIIYVAAEVYNDTKFDQSDQSFPKPLWHSYAFKTGAGNREELHFSKVELNKNFASAETVFMWKNLKIEDKIIIVGLGSNFLLVTTYTNENDSYTYREELQVSTVCFTMFEKWDAKTQRIKYFVVVALESAQQIFLKWYQIKDRTLDSLWDWPFHKKIIHIDIIKINHESKLLIVNSINGTYPSADIYSFNVNTYLDIWLFQKIVLDDIPSSVSVFNNNDNTFLCASFPLIDTVHIFKYTRSFCEKSSEEQKNFIFHQKLYHIGLKSLTSFRMGFHWYVIVASKHSAIYHMKNDLLLYPLSNLNLGSHTFSLAVPLNTYREDTMLLSESDLDVFIISWAGNENLKILGSFTHLVCGDDINCLEKTSKISLKKSTAFYFGGHQNIIISTKNGNPLLFKLLVKLKPVPDTVLLKLNELLHLKSDLEESYENQKVQIEELAFLKKKPLEDVENDSSREDFVRSTLKTNRSLEIASQTRNLGELLMAVNKLKEITNVFTHDVKNFKNDFIPNKSLRPDEALESFLPKKVTNGITFYGDVLIKELNVSTINGYNINDLLEDSFRKNRFQKIGGKKKIKTINAENILFEKIGNVLACDVIFSDDFWEKNKNIINGDVIWESKLDILEDFEENSNISTGVLFSQMPEHFDNLDMEELKITNDTYIQESFNSQPFILPVHDRHLNIHYLDIVNQARIENVNIQNNLDVNFINGKNLTDLLEKISFKVNRQQKPFNFLKIDGVFSSPILETQRLNTFDFYVDSKTLDKEEPKSHSNPNPIDHFRSVRNGKLRRLIHVYQNLTVTGSLLTERINNVSWSVLNDIIKKDEKKAAITGVKSFQKNVKTINLNVKGKSNGRFMDKIMTNFSDQTVDFRQIFDSVKFKNLSLKGLWDGICVQCLNQSIVWSSISGVHEGNLTFKDHCLLFTEGLNISDFVNNVIVKTEDLQNREDPPGKIEVKSIKASKLILHGSLITNDNINSMNLTEFDGLRVSLNFPQTVNKNFSQDNMTINGNIKIINFNNNEVSSVINSGRDTELIDEFLNGKISKIKKLMVNGNVTTAFGVNGFNLSKIFDRAVYIKKPSVIQGNIIFENTIHFNDINITNSIDGFNFKKLEKDIVFKRSHVFLSGAKNFSNIKVTKDMKARTLNGHLMQDIVSLKGDQSMKGPVLINGNVFVQGNVTAYGKINDVPVTDLLKKFSTHYNSYIYGGDLKLSNTAVNVDNLVVRGTIQKKNFNTIVEDVILKNGNFNISGKKIFKGEVKFKKNISVEGRINGLNFTELLADIVFINKPEKLKGIVIIKEAALKELEVTDYFNSSLINKFNLNDWFEDSIPLDKYEVVNGKKNFENVHVSMDVKVDFINGHLPSAMISLKDKQHIPATALFPRIHTSSDIPVNGLVNGMNLMSEYEDSVLLSGIQNIDGKTTFNLKFVVDGNVFIDTIKGKKIDNLITLDTEQNVKTSLQFLGSVTVRRGIDSLRTLNGIDLNEWNQRSVSLNREQVLSGLWTIKGNVKTKNIEGKGLLNSVSLPDVSKDVYKNRITALELKNETEQELNNQCCRIKNISEQFSKLPYLFQQFEITHEIETLGNVDSVITFKIHNADYLIVTFGNECLSSLYKWNKDNLTYLYLRQINVGPVDKWSVGYLSDVTYLFTSSLKSNISCREHLRQGNIWLFKGLSSSESEKYEHLHTTNAFVDIIKKNSTSNIFFTLDENGSLYQWTIEDNTNISSSLIMNVGQGNYKFIDFSITGGLAISNGKEIQQIRLPEGNTVPFTLPFSNPNIVALPLNGKTLIALAIRDKVVVYDNILDENVYSVIHTNRPGSILWFNFGSDKQAFLIIASHHKVLELYEYKSRFSGVSGFMKKMSIRIFSSRLQSVDLPSNTSYQLNKFVVVVQKKKIIFLLADMVGDFYQGKNSLC